ncbi:hypothetical protein [Gloeobacter kilaueensis]|uniref:Uncharacterized protein n=1 Tax=Gloeobacter kilaueensis (strain ATCC BAA-2537 / CCAP 1431/1 / ULC 316 / JS1) TaxID=1183438 RepID=U5QQR1_GLOK1|nr:hypothetical protein [Gloeobacter kilaueensis]AGY60030.1 hypothetical protein GKIL_3784 [Gloeobacter kilaueensis JS1]
MSSFREQLSEYTLLLLWSLWTELGVAGLHRYHTDCLVDPEALVLLTGWLGQSDPRLQEEVFSDWCRRYGNLLSLQRVYGLAKSFDYLDLKDSFDLIAQSLDKKPPRHLTQQMHSGSSGKSRLPSLTQPSLLLLRLAAIFGVGNRTVTIAALLAEPNGLSASDIAFICGYSKRNVANTLEALHLGGLLHKLEVKNRLQYHLTKSKQLLSLIGPLPENMTGWLFVFSFIALWTHYSQQNDGASTLRRAVSAVKLMKGMHSVLTLIGCSPPILEGEPEKDLEQIEVWVLRTNAEIAKGTSVLLKHSFLLPPLTADFFIRDIQPSR